MNYSDSSISKRKSQREKLYLGSSTFDSFPLSHIKLSSLDFAAVGSTFISKLTVRASDSIFSKMEGLTCHDTVLFGGIKPFRVYQDHFSQLSRFKNVRFENSTLGNFFSLGDYIAEDLTFFNCHFPRNTTAKFYGVKIDGDMIFDNTSLPDTLSFGFMQVKGDILLNNIVHPVSLTDPLYSSRKTKILIDDNFPIGKLKFSYADYDLVFSRFTTNEKKESLLNQLLDSQKRFGTSDGIKKADIELKDIQIKRGDVFLLAQDFYGFTDMTNHVSL